MVRPLNVTPEVPGSILGNTFWIFSENFQCFPPIYTKGTLVRNPGNPRIHVSVLYTGLVKEPARGLSIQ
jgi:hypothetical protein